MKAIIKIAKEFKDNNIDINIYESLDILESNNKGLFHNKR